VFLYIQGSYISYMYIQRIPITIFLNESIGCLLPIRSGPRSETRNTYVE